MTRFTVLVSMLACGVLAGCEDRAANEAAALPEAAPAAPPVVPKITPAALVESRNEPIVIGFHGFGPATFGANEEAVRIAWGYPLERGSTAPGSNCYYLQLDPPEAQGYGIEFMLEGDRFVRYDVDVARFVAPGDIVVGDDIERVRAAHAGHLDEQPHKYVEGGRVLVVTPPDGYSARLVFETDAGGVVTSWRIGVPPQVLYVEGCS